MLERSVRGRATLGADRGYDTRDFVAAVRARGVTPHAFLGHATTVAVPGAPSTGARRGTRATDRACGVDRSWWSRSSAG